MIWKKKILPDMTAWNIISLLFCPWLNPNLFLIRTALALIIKTIWALLHYTTQTGSNLSAQQWSTHGIHSRKESKMSRLVERKIFFILGASSPGQGGGTPSPSHWQSVSKSFVGWGRGLQTNSTARSDVHLEIGHQWSDEHHLGCFKYNFSLVLELVCFHFLRPILRIMADYVMAIIWL